MLVHVILVLVVVVSMVGFIGASAASAAGEGWLSGWANRIQLTIDHTKTPSSLTNFPVMVHLSAASGINKTNVSGIFSAIGSNAQKIAVTSADGLTQCYTEIEQWDSAKQQAYLWVKVPAISSTADTILYLYYDNNQASNTTYVGNAGSTASRNVWDTSYVGVYHMDEQGSGASGEIKDSTSKQHNGTAASDAGKAKPAAVQTRLGLGQAFNGGANNNYNARNYIMVPDNNDFSITTTGKFSYSFWYNPNVTLKWPDNNTGGDYVHTIGKGRSGGSWEWDFGLGLDNSGVSKYLGIMSYEFNQVGGKGDGVGLGPYYTAPSSHPEWNQHYSVGDWLYCVGTFDNSAKSMSLTVYYCDSTQKLKVKASRTNTGWSYLNSPGNTSEALYIGSVPNQYFDGILDEFRVSNSVRPAAWSDASFYSESDNLIKYSTATGTAPSTLSQQGTLQVALTPASSIFSLSGSGVSNQVLSSGSYQLNPGSYSWTTSASGYYSQSGSFTINAGQISTVSVSLVQDPPVNTQGTLVFNCNAASAVMTSGSLSLKPGSYALAVGTYNYVVSASGYASKTGTFALTSGQTINLNVSLTQNTTLPPSSSTGTFGLNSGNYICAQQASALQAMRFQNTVGAGILTKLEVLIDDTTPNGNVRMGVYADNNGKPGTRLLDAGEVKVTNGWVSISGLNLSVAASSYYWLAFNLQSTNNVRYQSGLPSNSHYRINGLTYGALPSSFPSSSALTNNLEYTQRATVTK